MPDTVKIISPIDGSIYAERPYVTPAAIEAAVVKARQARHALGEVTIAERA